MTAAIDEKPKKMNGASTLISTLLPMLGAAIASAFKGDLEKTQDAATAGLKAAITTIDNGLDHALAAFEKFERSNPVVETAIKETETVLKSLGLDLPSAEALENHIKAALFDLATGICPDLLKSAQAFSGDIVPPPLPSGNTKDADAEKPKAASSEAPENAPAASTKTEEVKAV